MILVFSILPVLWIAYRIIRFISTPIFRKAGLFNYYSPFLFSFRRFKNSYELHLGTAWDHFKNHSSIFEIKIYVLKGLLLLCKDIEDGKFPASAKIRGTTHYLNESSLEKFGFKSKKLNIADLLFFLLSYPEIILIRYLTSGKLNIIPLGKVKIVYCTASDIREHKLNIEKYLEFLVNYSRRQDSKDKYLNVA